MSARFTLQADALRRLCLSGDRYRGLRKAHAHGRHRAQRMPRCRHRMPYSTALLLFSTVKATRRLLHGSTCRLSAATERKSDKPILLFDVMDTIVWDPFYTEMPLFFDMKFQELLSLKDPHAWPEFERGQITEEQLYERFFKDRRPINGPGLLNRMVSAYSWVDEMEYILLDLARQGVEMHIITNYPLWYNRIEAKLGISRFLPWTFVSSDGPMKGLRKPEPEAYQVVSDTLNVPPERLMLIDDRQANIVGALESGWSALQFNNAPALRRDLIKRRILDGQRYTNPG